MIRPHHYPRLADLAPLAPLAPLALLAPLAGAAPGLVAARSARRSPAGSFAGRTGYAADHLPGFAVPFPATAAVAADVLPVSGRDDARLDYEHFTIVMSRGGDPWALDGRVPPDAQAGEELYTGNDFDRGHLVRREDPNWGPTAATANRDTFHFTNCAPQLSAFNQTTWLALEDFILGATRRAGERASVFTGPVFRADDPVYRGVAIPLAYWKVVAFVHDDGRPSASAYLIDHDVDTGGMSLILGAFRTYQQSVRSIERLTRLDFGELHRHDGFSNEEAATGDAVRRVIRRREDILL